MRNMSFSMTTQQVRARQKHVTRRLGWKFAKPGDLVQAIEKGQGLKKGEHVVKICVIRILANDPEPLFAIVSEHDTQETTREGFPNMNPDEFVEMFMRANRCPCDQEVQRIVFGYV